MSVRKLFIIGVSALMICALWGGCSKDTANFGPRSSTSSSGAGMYFPLAEGYSTTYTVQYSNGSDKTVRYVVGGTVDIGGGSAIEWNTFSSAGTVHTSYFKATETAVDHFSGRNEAPHRILELPLEYGHTWKSLVSIDDSYWPPVNDSLATGDGDGDKDDPDTVRIEDGGLGLSYPALGSTYLTVSGFETLEMSTGAYYSSALKVSSISHQGSQSYFWYVAGVGLVKYVIGATEANDHEGNEVGELVRYGFR